MVCPDRFRSKIVESEVVLAILHLFEVLALEPHSAMFGNHIVFCLGAAQCLIWQPHTVLFGNHMLSCLKTTQRLVWEPHNVLFENRAMFYLGITRCLVWELHSVSFGDHSMSCLEATQCLVDNFYLWCQVRTAAGIETNGTLPRNQKYTLGGFAPLPPFPQSCKTHMRHCNRNTAFARLNVFDGNLPIGIRNIIDVEIIIISEIKI